MTHTCPSIEAISFDDYRRELTQELPFILSKVTNEYREFITTQNCDDVKSFTAYQNACRGALSHIQILLKIATWVHPDIIKNIESDEEIDLCQLISDARLAIREHQI